MTIPHLAKSFEGTEHGPVELEARNSKTTTVTGLTNGRTPLMETAQVDSDTSIYSISGHGS